MPSEVYDPQSEPFKKFDFFNCTLHGRALKTFHNPWSVSGTYSVRTIVPLNGCEPLQFLSSYSNSAFSVFSLGFSLPQNVTASLSKFTNGCSGIGVQFGESVSVHAKTPGFDENFSGRIDLNHAPFHLSLQAPCLEDMQLVSPSVIVGVNQPIAKHLFFIGQFSGTNKLKAGIKFQPCAHMHAGVGIGNDGVFEGSMYAETHDGSTIGLIGKYGSRKSGIEFIGTRKVGKNEFVSENEGSKFGLPVPVLGLRYDSYLDRTMVFMETGMWASSNSSKMSFGMKVGLELTKFSDPRICFHLSANENKH
jgi:hypothetical protein